MAVNVRAHRSAFLVVCSEHENCIS